MRKLNLYVLIVICNILLFSLPIYASTEGFTLDYLKDFEQISENQWFKEETYNDEPFDVTVTITFEDSSLTDEEAFSTEQLESMKLSAMEDEEFNRFCYEPEVDTSGKYKNIYTSYICGEEGNENTVIIRKFYSETKCCIFTINSEHAMYIIAESETELGNSIVFEDEGYYLSPVLFEEPSSLIPAQTEIINNIDKKDSSIRTHFPNNILAPTLGTVVGVLIVFLPIFVIIKLIRKSRIEKCKKILMKTLDKDLFFEKLQPYFDMGIIRLVCTLDISCILCFGERVYAACPYRLLSKADIPIGVALSSKELKKCFDNELIVYETTELRFDNLHKYKDSVFIFDVKLINKYKDFIEEKNDILEEDIDIKAEKRLNKKVNKRKSKKR